jgi:hypothetical protein
MSRHPAAFSEPEEMTAANADFVQFKPRAPGDHRVLKARQAKTTLLIIKLSVNKYFSLRCLLY